MPEGRKRFTVPICFGHSCQEWTCAKNVQSKSLAILDRGFGRYQAVPLMAASWIRFLSRLETRYSPAVWIRMKAIVGDPNPKHISTIYVEPLLSVQIHQTPGVTLQWRPFTASLPSRLAVPSRLFSPKHFNLAGYDVSRLFEDLFFFHVD